MKDDRYVYLVNAQDGNPVGIYRTEKAAKQACKIIKSVYIGDTYTIRKQELDILRLDLEE
jgi:hypothetical protein